MIALVCATAVLAAGCEPPKPADPPPAKQGEPPPGVHIAGGTSLPPKLMADRNTLHKRVYGARLTIDPHWVDHRGQAARGNPLLQIDWAIDYDGPRRPFIVLKPSLDGYPAAGQTFVRFWHPATDGTIQTFELRPIRPDNPRSYRNKDEFTVAEDGQTARGRLMYDAPKAREKLGGQVQGVPRLWIQLQHAPKDRGSSSPWGPGPREEPWELDAWTGELWSPVAEVTWK
ncbi:MAG: hypothetical protein U0871_22495 [Gemmataceae bacterium]